MSARPLVIVGVGGFGRETIDVVRAASTCTAGETWSVTGALDDAPSAPDLQRLERLGVPYLGTLDALGETRADGVVVGIGNPGVRAAVVGRLSALNLDFPTFVHPRAELGSDVEVGRGCVVCVGASVGVQSRLGQFTHLNPHAVVGHDAIIEDFVSVNPNATISGAVTVGTRSLVGAGAVILQGLSIGADSVVGASACVTRSADGSTVLKGVPARAEDPR